MRQLISCKFYICQYAEICVHYPECLNNCPVPEECANCVNYEKCRKERLINESSL